MEVGIFVFELHFILQKKLAQNIFVKLNFAMSTWLIISEIKTSLFKNFFLICKKKY